MEVLVLSEADVYRTLPMRDCIGVMREALGALATGNAYAPLRMVVRLPDGSGLLAIMPGQMSGGDGARPALGMKAVAIFPGNAARGIDTHQGAVLLLDADTGRLSAVMDAAAVTAIRTAAVIGPRRVEHFDSLLPAVDLALTLEDRLAISARMDAA